MLNSVLKFSVFVLLVVGIAGIADSASAQECFLEICKEAEGAGDTGFTINFQEGGLISSVELFEEGDCFTYLFDTTSDLEVTETPTPGWTLVDVLCEGVVGIAIQDIADGIDADCVAPNTGLATCTFVNARVATNVPTLSQWGMISAAVGLALIGVFFAVKRLRASKQSDAIG
jgi:hypothetical protein